MVNYKTILYEAEVEQVIDRSKFIGYIKPVTSKAEADAFVQSIRAKHKDAAHNVPAYVIGDKFEIQWTSDDGEPSGTSGAPMLQMMVKEGITNVVVVVTRYFGGIKLGTGGLVRAYSSTAKMALEAAEVCAVREKPVLDIKIDYTYHGALLNLSEQFYFDILETEYMDKIIMKISCEGEEIDRVKKMFQDNTNGTAEFLGEAVILAKSKIL